MSKIFKAIWSALKGEDKNFTEMSINKALVYLSIPMILEMAMESLFAVVDIYWISRLGSENATSAIGLTEVFMFIIMSIALGLSMPATAMVARRIGEKKNKEAGDAAFQAIFLAIIVSIVVGLIGFFFAEELLRIMGSSEALISEGVIYTKIILAFNIVLMLLYVNNAIFRGAGDANVAMRTLWLSNGINLILDPLLIFGFWIFPEMGIKGAAIATCTGRSIGVLYQFYHMWNGKNVIHLIARNIKIKLDVIVRLLKLSIGGAGQHLITSASWIFIAWIINKSGEVSFAAYTYSFRVIIFTLLPSWGVAMAAATLVGQNLGAGRPDRAEESVWKAAFYNMLLLCFLSLLAFFFADDIMAIFSQNPRVIREGSLALKIICAGYIFYAYEMVIGQAFNGAGDTITPTVLNFICFWLIQIPLAYYLAVVCDWGPTGVYVTIAISSSILAIMAVLVFRRGKWKTVKV